MAKINYSFEKRQKEMAKKKKKEEKLREKQLSKVSPLSGRSDLEETGQDGESQTQAEGGAAALGSGGE